MSMRTPKYRFHRASGQAVVTLSGRDIYLGKHDTPESRAEYDRRVAEWLARGRSFAPPSGRPGQGVTVAELILAYVHFADGHYRKDGLPTSEPGNIHAALGPVRRLYGSAEATSFGPLALKAVRQAMIDADLCRNEINKRIGKVVRMFKWGVAEEIIPGEVHQALRAVTGLRKGRADVRESEPVRPVPDAFVDAIRPHVSPQVWAMVELQRLTGMRPGEVCMMRARDLDAVGSVWAYRPASHKTEHHGRDRTIYLGPKAQAVLQPWLKANLAAWLFSPEEAEASRLAALRAARKTPVQPSQRDRRKAGKARTFRDRYSPSAYAHAIERGCRKADVPIWGPNRLRHNAATAIRKEFGLDVARTVLGHSSAAITQVYAEADGAKAKEAMERLG